MGESEQSKPLAYATPDRIISDEEDSRLKSGKNHLRRRNCYICCGSCTAILAVLAVVILILALTVFKVKDPYMTMNSMKIDRMNVKTGGTLSSPISLNMTITADISVKNSNAASFKFGNTTTQISYRGTNIGEAHTPPGKAKARRTLRMNVTVNVMADRLLADQSMMNDIMSGSLSLSTYTKLGGRVNFLNIFKHHVDVTMSCNITVAVSNQTIEDQKCKRSVKL